METLAGLMTEGTCKVTGHKIVEKVIKDVKQLIITVFVKTSHRARLWVLSGSLFIYLSSCNVRFYADDYVLYNQRIISDSYSNTNQTKCLLVTLNSPVYLSIIM